jgi:hypothetical protein
MRDIAEQEQKASAAADLAREAARTQAPAAPRAQEATPKRRPLMLALLSLVAAGGIGLGVWFGLRDSSATLDVGDVAGTLQLANARMGQGSMSATITDPKWDALSKEEQKKLALQLLEQEAPKGIHTITLSDEKGATRALISDGPNGHSAIIP